MEIKSILIKDTTREERIRIVQEGLNQWAEPVIFAMAVIISVEVLWMLFMSPTLTARKNCARSTRSTEVTLDW